MENRRKLLPWHCWVIAALILPLAYPLSMGPVLWLARNRHLPFYSSEAYIPLLRLWESTAPYGWRMPSQLREVDYLITHRRKREQSQRRQFHLNRLLIQRAAQAPPE